MSSSAPFREDAPEPRVHRGRLLIEGQLVPGVLRVEGGRIASVEVSAAEESSETFSIVTPGLIDLHVHGFGGAGPVDDLQGMTRALARTGTTACLPTLFPEAPARLGATAERVWAAASSGVGARVLGLHLEGPFVNPLSAGALPREELAEPSRAALRDILGPSTGDGRGIRTVTLAPELAGSAELVEELVRSDIRVSLGHSLARASEARAAARAGAVGATHLFNAMGPLHHRDAGLANFALSEDALCAELIGDLVHVGPDGVQLALRARGPSGLALVSDALRGAGTGCSVFHSHGKECHVRDGAIWIEDPDGTPRLTGAAASQLEAVRRLVGAGVCSAAEALTMACETPAWALGCETELGRLVRGARADLLVLTPELELSEVWIDGKPFPIDAPGSGDPGR